MVMTVPSPDVTTPLLPERFRLRRPSATTGNMTSFYDVLGVGVDADPDEVRRAYRRKAQLLHPDRYTGSPGPERQQAEEEMKAVNTAWNTLGDAEARRRYDVERGLVSVGDELEPFEDDEWWEEPGPDEEGSGSRRTGLRVAVALVIVLSIVGSLIAAVSRSGDEGPRWSAGAVAELRFAALNAGLSAPQAECFVQAVTSRYGPSEPVSLAATQQLLAACR